MTIDGPVRSGIVSLIFGVPAGHQGHLKGPAASPLVRSNSVPSSWSAKIFLISKIVSFLSGLIGLGYPSASGFRFWEGATRLSALHTRILFDFFPQYARSHRNGFPPLGSHHPCF